MASCPVDFKPENTTWFRCSTEIEFDCDTPPKKIDDTPYLVVGFGFIFAHRYDIGTNVLSYERHPCSIAGCDTGVRYSGQLLVRLRETAGIGFGFGKGTIAFGFTPRPKRSQVPFETHCICCDKPPADAEARTPKEVSVAKRDNPALDVIATTVAATSLAGGMLIARVYPDLGLSPYLEVGVIGLASVALLGVVSRVVRSSGNRSDDSTKTPERQTLAR